MQAMKNPFDRPNALITFGTALPILQRGYRSAADRAMVHIGLSQAMAWPLVMAGRLGSGVRPGVLAEVLAVEGPSLVRQLDQLVENGLVERREDAVDRRAKTIHLTPAGNRARAKIEAALDTLREGLFEGVSDDDMAACLRVFETLQARLDRTPRSATTSRP